MSFTLSLYIISPRGETSLSVSLPEVRRRLFFIMALEASVEGKKKRKKKEEKEGEKKKI